MQVTISSKGVSLDNKAWLYLDKYSQKINHFLPHLNPGLPSLNLFIKKTHQKYHAKLIGRRITHNYLLTKAQMANYEGWMRLIIPKKALYAHFKGETIEECLHSGVDKILIDLKKWKNLHFKSQSQYPSQKSIRKDNFYQSE